MKCEVFIFVVLVVVDVCLCDDANVVIDLKFANDRVDFVKVKKAGVKAVIHMVTMGSDFEDPTYRRRKEEAVKVGLLWGAYHIADGSPGSRQALNFLNTVGEDTSILLAIGIEKSNNSMNLQEAENFVNTVYQARQRYPLVYGHDYLTSLVEDSEDSVVTKCGLWTFQYQDTVTVPKGWSNWTLWQYTDGVNGPQPRGVQGVGPCGRDTINTDLNKDVETLWSNY